jgi:plastocyanin
MRERRGARTLIGAVTVLAIVGAACSKSSSPPANQPSSGATVEQGAGGFVFTPSTFSVKTGEAITVKNVGSAAHTFTVTGKGIDVVNNAGQSQSVTKSLAPGTDPFVCRFHASLGMTGTLTVTG